MTPESQDVYRAFGLNIASELPFLNMQKIRGTPDVVVRYGDVPDALPDALNAGVRYQAAPGAFLLRVDGVARYHVTQGDMITIHRESEAQDEEVLLFLMGSAIAALLHQRQMLPLHAGAIAVDGGAVLFMGPSGIGKSTLTAAFHQRGYPVLADDVCGVTAGQDHQVHIVSGFNQLKLWEDSLDRLDRSSDGLRRARRDPDFRKFFVPIEMSNTPALPVRSLFILGETSQDHFEVTELTGMDRIGPIMANTYRPKYPEGLGVQQAHFRMCSLLADQARVMRLSRPKTGFRLDELMNLAEGRW